MNAFKERREGFALSTTIVALVVIGLLVTGGFFAASQEGRISTSSADADLALRVAEHGINTAVGTWTVGSLSNVEKHGPTSIALKVGGRTIGTATVEARRLGDRLYFVTSMGRVARGNAERKLGMLVRTSQMEVKTDRALSTFSPIEVGGNSKVSGQDVPNPAWDPDDCPEPQGTKTGIVARDTTLVTTFGSGTIEGNPPKAQDSSITRENLVRFGEWDYEDLIAQADKIIPPGTNAGGAAPSLRPDGTCDVRDNFNWGAPRNPNHACHHYFPIIYAQGDLELNGKGQGQGILIVEGNLDIRGGFEFNGIVIVRGKIETGSGNSKIYGSVIVLGERTSEKSKIKDCDEEGCESKVTGNPIIHLSTCAIERAVHNNPKVSRIIPIAERSWVDLTASGVGVD